jgi:hypothetical protein
VRRCSRCPLCAIALWLSRRFRRRPHAEPPRQALPIEEEIRSWPTVRIGSLLGELLRGAPMVPGADRDHSIQLLLAELRARREAIEDDSCVAAQ